MKGQVVAGLLYFGAAFRIERSPIAEDLFIAYSLAGRASAASNPGMVIGMATTKITITLQEEQVAEIRALVAAGKAPNLSSFVQHAVRIALFDAAGWQEMLTDALHQTGGPLTKKERAWADALLAPGRRKRSSRRGKAA